MDALEEASTVVGYTTYIDLIQPFLEDKEIVSTGMKQEIDRCQEAVRLACAGEIVCVVSSGDAGIYGMAGLVLELVMKLPKEERPWVEVIPGISAVNAAAALLGAPLMHDFAVISLSDLMTPWELIQKRILLASEGDMVIALYNPKSKGRPKHLEKAQEIMLSVKGPKTPVGIVKKAGRKGESVVISTLEDFIREDIDMQSIVIIGNKETYVAEDRMITPRGYSL